MPLHVTLLRPDTKEVVTECVVNDCGPRCCRCTYMINGVRRCRLSSCYEENYCWIHLKKVRKVRIAPSRIVVRGQSIGLGLFALTQHPLPRPLLTRLRARRGTREEKEKYLVFRNRQVIGRYSGEHLSKAELDAKYDMGGTEYTAPYALTLSDGSVLDSLCKRNYVAYANDARGSRFTNNAEVLPNLDLVATRSIWQGEEILWDYGREYWTGPHLDVQIRRQRRRR